MKYIDNLAVARVSFIARHHSIELGSAMACEIPLHIHPAAELLLVESGEVTLSFLGGETVRLTRGDCAFIHPFSSHSYERAENTEFYRFNFQPSLIKSFFSSIGSNVGKTAKFSVSLNEYASFLEAVDSRSLSFFKVKGFLYNIIGDYERQTDFCVPISNANLLDTVINYIYKHQAEIITLDSTAQALGYNAKYLSRCLNRSAGFGFSTLLSMLRTESAKHLLKNTDRTLLDISVECGFGSECTFYRQFKCITGLTPREYRKNYNERISINEAKL